MKKRLLAIILILITLFTMGTTAYVLADPGGSPGGGVLPPIVSPTSIELPTIPETNE